jgi:UDP-N-acetylmuramate dehydrogenase
VAQADAAGRRLLVLGGGSNLVAGEQLGDLVVVRDRRSGVAADLQGPLARVRAQAGAAWDALVAWTLERGWAALAPLSGIPGSVGALPVQNVGAYGAAASDVVELVRAYDRASGQVVELRADDLAFGYRDSALKRSVAAYGGITPRWVVLDVVFALPAGAGEVPASVPPTGPGPSSRCPEAPDADRSKAASPPAQPQPATQPRLSADAVSPSQPRPQPADAVSASQPRPRAADAVSPSQPRPPLADAVSASQPRPPAAAAASPSQPRPQVAAADCAGVEVRYAQLAEVLGVPLGAWAPGWAVRQAVLGIRRRKGMVLDAADHDTWSAGSYFTNPVVPPEVAAALPPEAPRFPAEGAAPGWVKTSAAWLMTQAGVERGFALTPAARAATSSKHVLALTNRGGATAAEVLALEAWIAQRVRGRFGVELTREPVLVD